ncbi:MAG: hypothetical protein WC290_02290 [archaeon]|jgi:hypothetical protein
MENKRESEIGGFENIPERAEREIFSHEKLEKLEEPELKIKSIDEIAGGNIEAIKENSGTIKITEEEKKVLLRVKESQGASIGKIAKIINTIKRKFTPFGVDSYHDKMTKKKDGQ